MWLSEILKKRHGNNVIPPLYTKEKLANKIDFYYIVKQQKYLCDFTEACFKQENLLLDPVFALFFQSDLTINELEDFTCGKFDDDFLREIWVKNGITKVPEIDYWDKVTSDEYYEEVICKQNTEQPIWRQVAPSTLKRKKHWQDDFIFDIQNLYYFDWSDFLSFGKQNIILKKISCLYFRYLPWAPW